jgi:hypothetical protein
MKLISLTENKIISGDIIIARKTKDRITGLLKEKSPKALYLETRWGIHTFGMKFPIDCVILDKNWKISVIKENLLPWRMFIWNPKYSRVLELPPGTVKNLGLKLGNEMKLE